MKDTDMVCDWSRSVKLCLEQAAAIDVRDIRLSQSLSPRSEYIISGPPKTAQSAGDMTRDFNVRHSLRNAVGEQCRIENKALS